MRSEESMNEELERLRAENERLKAGAGVRALTMKVSDKGALSVYGLGRFPVTLYKAIGAAFVTEAWMAKKKPEERLDCRPGEDPKREECVYLLLEHVSGSRVWFNGIARDGTGKGELGEWREGQDGKVQGRFTGMIGFWQ